MKTPKEVHGDLRSGSKVKECRVNRTKELYFQRISGTNGQRRLEGGYVGHEMPHMSITGRHVVINRLGKSCRDPSKRWKMEDIKIDFLRSPLEMGNEDSE